MEGLLQWPTDGEKPSGWKRIPYTDNRAGLTPSRNAEGGESMAENEKKLIKNLASLPESLQEEFLSQIQGAATAVKVLSSTAAESGEAAEKGG